MFWLELIVVLGMLLVGARVGGIFLGMSSGVSLAVLIFGFGCTPGKPPIDVVMIIMAVVVTVSVLQASGGMDYLIQVVIRMLRSNPKRISIYAPLISWLFTFMCGTGYIAYGILPVIERCHVRRAYAPSGQSPSPSSPHSRQSPRVPSRQRPSPCWDFWLPRTSP